MEQVFEGTPKATIKLDGRKVTRTHVVQDWGAKLQWLVSRNGTVVATAPARTELSFEHTDTTPGRYEVVLQQFKYVNYRKDAKGQFTQSKFVDVSNKVSYVIS